MHPAARPPPPQRRILKKNVQEYFLDEIESRDSPNRIEYERFDYSNATDVFRYREEIGCLDEMLAKERERHKEKQQEFRDRWQAAARQMKQTDESIVKFNHHYQESIEEKERNLLIAARQEELHIMKQKDVQRLNKEKAILTEILQQTKERLKHFKPVEKYLEKVQEMSQGEFNSIRELLDRFNLLKDSRDALLESDLYDNERVRRRQSNLDNLNLVKENEAVLLNNYIFDLTEELENLEEKEHRLDEGLTHVKETAAKRAMNIGKVRMASYNLYLQTCKLMKRLPIIPPIDTVRQLNYIQGSLLQINKLRKHLHRILNLALKAHRKEQKEKARPPRVEDHHHVSKDDKHGKETKQNFDVLFGLVKPTSSQVSSKFDEKIQNREMQNEKSSYQSKNHLSKYPSKNPSKDPYKNPFKDLSKNPSKNHSKNQSKNQTYSSLP